MLNKNIETILGCDAEYEDASTVLFGAPFDSTTSYLPAPGSAAAPVATSPLAWRPIVPIKIRT